MNDLHFLYVGGDLDYASLERIVGHYDYYSLGPQCWILRASLPQRGRLLEQLERILPREPEKAELLLYPLTTDRSLLTREGGLGLRAWLTKSNRS
jgi:hypothetical protein